MASTAFALFGLALVLVVLARHATINRRRATVFAEAILLTAAANVAVRVRAGERMTQPIGLLTGAALVAAVNQWAARVRTGR
jgi:hypothetical protein